VAFDGRHYRVDGLRGTPVPIQRPHPPILVGGGGRRILELAARHADIVGLNPTMAAGTIGPASGPDATVAATERKLGWIRAAAGERFEHLELQTRVHLVAITGDRDSIAGALAPAFGLSPEEALASPHTLCGSVDQVIEDLLDRRERFGLSAIGIGLDAVDALAPVVARLAGT
jgi:alkanesulfonate monooxygenase SsuD/methylene tetrahydromethanopterin reductase-like flavin-dependent oxidoreductase (luciferase family)